MKEGFMALCGTQKEATTFVLQSPLIASIRGLSANLTATDRKIVANQIGGLISNYYVHLPLKTTSLGIAPAQEFLLLLDDVPLIQSDYEFFRRLMTITKQLRDRHTCLKLPAPWSNMVAFLPFAVESYWSGARRPLVVSKILSSVDDPRFQPGVEITHWNGIPIARYIEQLGWQLEGANPYARITLALRSITLRPLAYMLPPDEDWVTVTYVADGGFRSVTVPWRAYVPAPGSGANMAASAALGAARVVQGVDQSTLIVNGGWRDLYSGTSAKAVSGDNGAIANPLADNLTYRIVPTRAGTFGYIRLFSFQTNDTVGFLNAFANVLKLMPRQGLIIDLRANPGGTIPAGEGILRLLSRNEVITEKVSFRVTPCTQRIANSVPYFEPWRRSINMVLETGESFSQGYSLSDPADAAGLNGSYQGRVVLIIDALCYSTTDFFAAGFQDNRLGKIIGTDPVTGAGGANVWSYSELSQYGLASGIVDLAPLPRGVDMNVAVRRSMRVGDNEGIPVEGLGVTADHVYALTERDVLGQNEDLIEFAGTVLAAM
jgi:Peptidase family S41